MSVPVKAVAVRETSGETANKLYTCEPPPAKLKGITAVSRAHQIGSEISRIIIQATPKKEGALNGICRNTVFGIIIDSGARILPVPAIYFVYYGQHNLYFYWQALDAWRSPAPHVGKICRSGLESSIQVFLWHIPRFNYGPTGYIYENSQKGDMNGAGSTRHDTIDPTRIPVFTGARSQHHALLSLEPLCDLVSEVSKGLQVPLGVEGWKTLCDRIYYGDVKNTPQIEAKEVNILALQAPLPRDGDEDFPENRTPLCRHLTDLTCLADFRAAFIGALKGAYGRPELGAIQSQNAAPAHNAFFSETGVLHGSLTPHNFKFMKHESGTGVTGVLVDLDPLELHLDGLGPVPSEDPLRVPFQAYELVGEPHVKRHYRHDLESFYCILLWYALCNDFGGPGGRMVTRRLEGERNAMDGLRWFSPGWNHSEPLYRDSVRLGMMRGWKQDLFWEYQTEYERITKSFEGILGSWLRPLWEVFSHSNLMGGRDNITWEAFLAAICCQP